MNSNSDFELSLDTVTKRFLDPNFVLVYQMGKVGSSAITESLRSIGVDAFHCHSMSRILVDRFISHYRDVGEVEKIPEHERWHMARYAIEIFKLAGQIKVIGGYREPISQLISTYFGAELQYRGGRNVIARSGEINAENIRRHLVDVLKRMYDESGGLRFAGPMLYDGEDDMCVVAHHLDFCLNWFDNEVLAHFGVDLLAVADPAAAYVLNDNLLFLKFRTINRRTYRITTISAFGSK